MMTEAASRRIVIAGGAGFLGENLASHLSSSAYEVVVLSRRGHVKSSGARHEVWDGRTIGSWIDVLNGAEALVNLAGRSVDCVKTPEHCDEILRSRVESTRVLGEALRRVDRPPAVWVQMSTAHIYGDPPEAKCDEGSALGYGLAPTVGRAWEAAHVETVPDGMRSVILRTSFVLGRHGGALRRLAHLARFGLGGRIGHGRQGISWIHELDMNRLLERAISEDQMQGVYVATAPEPVSNEVFMRELRRAIGMPIGLPAAGWMVRIGAPLVMRTDPELALYGRYCVPTRLLQEGFEFSYPTIRAAFAHLAASG